MRELCLYTIFLVITYAKHIPRYVSAVLPRLRMETHSCAMTIHSLCLELGKDYANRRASPRRPLGQKLSSRGLLALDEVKSRDYTEGSFFRCGGS
jgi:hypothetical protein